jgi:toxin YoeB
MTYTLQYLPKAAKQLGELAMSGNMPLLRKIDELLAELREHPYSGTGKPEKLKRNLAGRWSRRINQEHRLIYTVEEHIVTVTVVSVKGHYEQRRER